MGIYRYERRLWLAIEGKEGIKKSRQIIPGNKGKLLDYAEYLKATGKSLPRQDKLMRTLKIFATLLGPISFKEATKENMVQVLAKAEDRWKSELSQKGRPGPASARAQCVTPPDGNEIILVRSNIHGTWSLCYVLVHELVHLLRWRLRAPRMFDCFIDDEFIGFLSIAPQAKELLYRFDR